MAKYKVGDKVRVRSDLKCGPYYMEDGQTRDSVVIEMTDYAGKVVTISSVNRKYRIEEDDWNWTDEMFEGLAEAEQEFHVYDTVKHCKYGIGTVIEINKTFGYLVDFDEWNEDFFNGNCWWSIKSSLTLVQAYSPN